MPVVHEGVRQTSTFYVKDRLMPWSDSISRWCKPTQRTATRTWSFTGNTLEERRRFVTLCRLMFGSQGHAADRQRANEHATYDKRSPTTPFLDQLIVQMGTRFTELHSRVGAGLKLVPSSMEKVPLPENLALSTDYLPSPDYMEAELEQWSLERWPNCGIANLILTTPTLTTVVNDAIARHKM